MAETTSTTPGRTPRRYDSSGRQAAARARRRRIVEVATDLFLRQGYGATSIDQVAAGAEVSVQTVYGAFESKAGLLARAVDVALVGDDEDVPLREREESQQVLDEPDPAVRVALAAAIGRGINERAGSLLTMVETASGTDPALADLHQRLTDGRRADARAFAETLGGALRPGLSATEAGDLVALLVGPAVWTDLVGVAGWDPDRCERWIADALARLLLADPT